MTEGKGNQSFSIPHSDVSGERTKLRAKWKGAGRVVVHNDDCPVAVRGHGAGIEGSTTDRRDLLGYDAGEVAGEASAYAVRLG
ncbi:MAG: hypothetical protein GEU80_04970 [Dehalococcoidia bacterium]|nr:hypothetical protein [Dehalococcoidia bacterium]